MESKIKYPQPRQIFQKVWPKKPAISALYKWMLASGVLFFAIGSGIAALLSHDVATAVACVIILSLAFGFVLMLIGPKQWRFSYEYLKHVGFHALAGSIGIFAAFYLVGGSISAAWFFTPLLACIPTATGLLFQEWEGREKAIVPTVTIEQRNLAKEYAILADTKVYLSLTIKDGTKRYLLGYSVDPVNVANTPLALLLSTLTYYHRDQGNPLPDFECVTIFAPSIIWPVANNYLHGERTFSELGLRFKYRLVKDGFWPKIRRICQLNAQIHPTATQIN